MRSAIIPSGLCALLLAELAGCTSSEGAGGGTVTYTKDVQPILKAKCSTCHAGDHAGMHDIAINYADALKPVQSLQFDECWGDVTTMSMPKTVGACAAILSREGKMPYAFGCDQKPQPTPAICVSPAQQDVLAAWVADGMPE
jgi:hypothetical protein